MKIYILLFVMLFSSLQAEYGCTYPQFAVEGMALCPDTLANGNYYYVNYMQKDTVAVLNSPIVYALSPTGKYLYAMFEEPGDIVRSYLYDFGGALVSTWDNSTVDIYSASEMYTVCGIDGDIISYDDYGDIKLLDIQSLTTRYYSITQSRYAGMALDYHFNRNGTFIYAIVLNDSEKQEFTTGCSVIKIDINSATEKWRRDLSQILTTGDTNISILNYSVSNNDEYVVLGIYVNNKKPYEYYDSGYKTIILDRDGEILYVYDSMFPDSGVKFSLSGWIASFESRKGINQGNIAIDLNTGDIISHIENPRGYKPYNKLQMGY